VDNLYDIKKGDPDLNLKAFSLLCDFAIHCSDKHKIREMEKLFATEPLDRFILIIEGEILRIL